jgi:ABC-type transport system involved in multi-copper enzyme maturation permease subunit
MIFLPIVERELRVAARKHSTFWARVIAATVALIIGIGCMLFLSAIPGGGFGRIAAGRVLFSLLTWFAIFGVFSAGLFFTSDCVSEEKREGTIGFLFLTDLKGIDVAAGKLLANSLRSFYALLALFPILGLTLLLGGVTGAQFCLTCLALANALLYSLVAGLAVSTLGRDSQKALAGTLILLLCVVFGGPIADSTVSYFSHQTTGPFWAFSSPGYSFLLAGAADTTRFWTSFAITQGTVWILFASVCFLISRTWQARDRRTQTESKTWVRSLRYGSVKSRLTFRRKWLSRNPVLWLSARERWQTMGIWILVVALIVGCAYAKGLPRNSLIGWSYVAKFIMLVLYLWAASQASRFFAEARRTGLVELLLVGPLPEKQIVQGQWRAITKMFGIPILLILAIDTVGTYFSQSVWRQMAGQGGSAVPVQAIAIGGLVASAVTALGNLIALCWYGMWMGLTSRSANLATLKTIVFAQIVPWFVINFASAMVFPLIMFSVSRKAGTVPPTLMTWWPYVMIYVAAALYLAKNIGFILWARKRLYCSFREEATRTYRTVQAPAPIVPTQAPPIIPVLAG